MSDLTPRAEEGAKEPEALLVSLEAELGVKGTAAVFRKALVLAKVASAEARARQEAYAANDLAYRLRSWGENDPDPDYFTGELLSGVLMDCGAGSEAILVAEARAAKAEAEVRRLRMAIQAFLDGDYKHPRSYRPGKCPHGIYYYEECGSCNDEHFATALQGASDAKP